MLRWFLSAVVLTSALTAQDRAARFRIGLGVAGGELDYRTEGSPLDGDTDAGLFRLEFEGTSKRGVGGGLRIEGIASDDDLFVEAGFAASEVAQSSLFLHFTYRVESHRFAMPLRAGLKLDALVVNEVATDTEVTFRSVGPYFEFEPEVTLVRSGGTLWSLYSEIGFGGAVTDIELDNDPRDYESSTGYFGFELGTRLLLGSVELSLAYVGRWTSTDQSEVEQGLFIFGNEVEFHGLFFGLGIVF